MLPAVGGGNIVYTCVTFAPVQGFIEKSRKLRDLYGSSFILSHLAQQLCEGARARGHTVVSPALVATAQGTPNQIVIAGNWPKPEAREVLATAWGQVVDGCRAWLERQVQGQCTWQAEWDGWKAYAWEFFWGQGDSIAQARYAVNKAKRERNWTGLTWRGESSTLAGTDAIAWPGMGQNGLLDKPWGEHDRAIREFYRQLSEVPGLGEAFVDASEQLSIPELIKRLVTYSTIAKPLGFQQEIPATFRELSGGDRKFWFQGDGDRLGAHLQSLKEQGGDEAAILNRFSQAMRDWGTHHLIPAVDNRVGRVVYAGGDDFLGVLYAQGEKAFSPRQGLAWWMEFPRIWQQHGQKLTVSVGAVLAAGQVPQRDVLQHCRETEQAAKAYGRDRLMVRVVFNGGNYLQWGCPWHFLQPVFAAYRDRRGATGLTANWGHFYNDVAVLETRHALSQSPVGSSPPDEAIALALFELYFGAEQRRTLEAQAWGENEKSAIVQANCPPAQRVFALNQWVCNLAKVGFQLCSDT
ncbi:MAG: Cas10/Cmr2 second palm domain-containing protein [Pseudanabaenaceae cyanobacterium]